MGPLEQKPEERSTLQGQTVEAFSYLTLRLGFPMAANDSRGRLHALRSGTCVDL